MNTPANDLDSPKKLAIENIRKELERIYRKAVGREADPKVLQAEAEDFVAKYGPDAHLDELFSAPRLR